MTRHILAALPCSNFESDFCHLLSPLLAVTAYRDDLNAPSSELGGETLELEEILGADRAVQAAVEDDKVESFPWRCAKDEPTPRGQGNVKRGDRVSRQQGLQEL